MTCNGVIRKRLHGCIFCCALTQRRDCWWWDALDRKNYHPSTHYTSSCYIYAPQCLCWRSILEPLDAAETAKLAGAVAGRELEPDEGLHLFHETGGYPLFVVETVRAELGRASGQSLWRLPALTGRHRLTAVRTLPPRVQAVLVGRLMQVSARWAQILWRWLRLSAANLRSISCLLRALPTRMELNVRSMNSGTSGSFASTSPQLLTSLMISYGK